MLSIIVTWRNRKELKTALPSFLNTIELIGGELIVVNFNGDDRFFEQQINGSEKSLTTIKVNNQRYFHKTVAANIGAHYANESLLFFCDCDIVLIPQELMELCQQLNERAGYFGTLSGVTESEKNSIGRNHVINFGYQLKIKTANGRELHIIDQEEDTQTGYRNAPGLLMVKKPDFLSVNGYNGALHGWGWEDQDMIGRLTLGAGLKRVYRGHAVHISHDDISRTGNYPQKDRWNSRDQMFRQALSNYDQNDFMGTYSTDVKAVDHHQNMN